MLRALAQQRSTFGMNVVDLTGRPVSADRLARTRQPNQIVAEISHRLREVDTDKLLGYLASVLPVDAPDFQIQFVLDRAEWLRDCAAILLAEADNL